MHSTLRTFFCSLPLALASLSALAQTPAERVIIVSPVVGEVIDGAEKARFGLFPYYSADSFQDARFLRALAPDSAITLRTRLRDGRQVAKPFTFAEFQAAHDLIERRQRELDANPQPAAGTASSSQGTPELPGRSYSIELRSGTTFTGVLQTTAPDALEFMTKDLGLVTVQRSNLKRLSLLTTEQAAKGYTDAGNGTRIFFAPTARNLRQGEGYLQDIDIILVGVNYGITDNISVGALVPLLPGVGGNVFAITPKVSGQISEKFSIGAGALYARAFGVGGGVAYGVGTYGTADDNATLGLGYGFADGKGASSSPVLLLGGAKRLSRGFSVLNETYIFSEGLAGLVGGRLQGERYGGSLGFLYGSGYIGGIYPAYLELTYRFGKHK
ncbi:hypothetical protein Q5H92_03570 [Hymenobacter sp. M29]|uniref:Uncharacterized protein n=1 Tax=Hymenobacter mellowenesis TaxID=3063995 RepID=A0ABT9A6G2_9BACT|nr:hypothetical protein [Hymenobacter sp. M29]MDO7845423.1 hypothetical protein [Hymenobacter sp. M29]